MLTDTPWNKTLSYRQDIKEVADRCSTYSFKTEWLLVCTNMSILMFDSSTHRGVILPFQTYTLSWCVYSASKILVGGRWTTETILDLKREIFLFFPLLYLSQSRYELDNSVTRHRGIHHCNELCRGLAKLIACDYRQYIVIFTGKLTRLNQILSCVSDNTAKRSLW